MGSRREGSKGRRKGKRQRGLKLKVEEGMVKMQQNPSKPGVK